MWCAPCSITGPVKVDLHAYFMYICNVLLCTKRNPTSKPWHLSASSSSASHPVWKITNIIYGLTLVLVRSNGFYSLNFFLPLPVTAGARVREHSDQQSSFFSFFTCYILCNNIKNKLELCVVLAYNIFLVYSLHFKYIFMMCPYVIS